MLRSLKLHDIYRESIQTKKRSRGIAIWYSFFHKIIYDSVHTGGLMVMRIDQKIKEITDYLWATIIKPILKIIIMTTKKLMEMCSC